MNESVFDEPLTSEAQYWLGMLLSDGCVYAKKYPTRSGGHKTYHQITLGLKIGDHGHVEKFKEFLQSDRKIVIHTWKAGERLIANQRRNFPERRASVLCVTSDRLAEILVEYGIVQRKTYSVKVVPRLQNSRDFWRGMVDGDGHVGMTTNRGRRYPQMYLCGVLEVIVAFREYVRRHGLEPKPIKVGSVWRLGFNSASAQKILQELYYPGCVSLDRKQEIASQCLAWRKLPGGRRYLGKSTDADRPICDSFER